MTGVLSLGLRQRWQQANAVPRSFRSSTPVRCRWLCGCAGAESLGQSSRMRLVGAPLLKNACDVLLLFAAGSATAVSLLLSSRSPLHVSIQIRNTLDARMYPVPFRPFTGANRWCLRPRAHKQPLLKEQHVRKDSRLMASPKPQDVQFLFSATDPSPMRVF